MSCGFVVSVAQWQSTGCLWSQALFEASPLKKDQVGNDIKDFCLRFCKATDRPVKGSFMYLISVLNLWVSNVVANLTELHLILQ